MHADISVYSGADRPLKGAHIVFGSGACIRMCGLHVDVELNGELTRGLTVVDQRPTLDKAPANAAVTMHIESSTGRSLITNAMMDY